MPVDLRVLVLPAFDDLETLPGEADPWRRAYDLDETTRVPGLPAPLAHGEAGVGVVPTGIGKTAAATTTAALCAGDAVGLDDALVLSVGVAGGPPALPVGSVVIADHLLDWDDKCRFDPDGDPPIAENPYTASSGVFEIDPDLVADATALGEDVDLATAATADGDPVVVNGTNVCADELWHGRTVAEQVSRFVDERGCPPYRATEMEDVGTATALRRFGLGDRYLSVRGIANHDRPDADTGAAASFHDSGFEAGFDVGLTNAVRVGRAIADGRLE